MVGEIGGDAEERAAEFIASEISKPVVAYIAGFTAPPGKQMGHAGAIISGSSGTAQAKKDALEAKGVRVGESPTETARRSAGRSASRALGCGDFQPEGAGCDFEVAGRVDDAFNAVRPRLVRRRGASFDSASCSRRQIVAVHFGEGDRRSASRSTSSS